MKIDPRESCANVKENSWWAFVHDTVAHPLMALFGWPRWALEFHDFTSERAWPRERPARNSIRMVQTRRWGVLSVKRLDADTYSVMRRIHRGRFITRATVILCARDVTEAVERAALLYSKDGEENA